MAINKWECQYPGCTSSCVGSGGAIGLRAIGWFFEPGVGYEQGKCLCPWHRPDSTVRHTWCHGSEAERHDSKIERCPICAAEYEAAFWQTLMMKLGTGNPYRG